jgi:hypothetical protein
MADRDDYLVLKIAAGVLLALVLWNAYARYQERKALEAGLAELQRIAADPDPLGWRAKARQSSVERDTGPTHRPVPPGFRCMDGSLLKRVPDGWTQVTDRHNEWYCPHGGTVDDCYRVSAATTGCGGG